MQYVIGKIAIKVANSLPHIYISLQPWLVAGPEWWPRLSQTLPKRLSLQVWLRRRMPIPCWNSLDLQNIMMYQRSPLPGWSLEGIHPPQTPALPTTLSLLSTPQHSSFFCNHLCLLIQWYLQLIYCPFVSSNLCMSAITIIMIKKIFSNWVIFPCSSDIRKKTLHLPIVTWVLWYFWYFEQRKIGISLRRNKRVSVSHVTPILPPPTTGHSENPWTSRWRRIVNRVSGSMEKHGCSRGLYTFLTSTPEPREFAAVWCFKNSRAVLFSRPHR